MHEILVLVTFVVFISNVVLGFSNGNINGALGWICATIWVVLYWLKTWSTWGIEVESRWSNTNIVVNGLKPYWKSMKGNKMIEIYKTRGKVHILIKIRGLYFRTYQGFVKRHYCLGIKKG